MPHSGTGDVKYHHGAEGLFSLDDDQVKVRLYPNPSHLEFVDPVVTGGARAAQTEHSGPKLHHNPHVAVPVLLHGDAAFPGQGVVAETLNLQSLAGYSTGGTIHLITDNQVGFTTDPHDDRSTPYAGDMAKGFNCPIIHVNADDVEACIAAVAAGDGLPRAVGPRRGHRPDRLPPLRPQRDRRARLHAAEDGGADQGAPAGLRDLRRAAGRARAWSPPRRSPARARSGSSACRRRSRSCGRRWRRASTRTRARPRSAPASSTGPRAPRSRPRSPRSACGPSTRSCCRCPTASPSTASCASRCSRGSRSSRTGEIEYGHAEALAFASLLTEGTHIRLTGQDTERGTFSHRHLALHDENTGLRYVPIQNLSGALAPFELHNSPLSEAACLGFEYGYSAASPESLILWEAQFGDFANSAQVIIDQFIVAGESKWGQTTRLTLLLPHGYEGAGPEHSSARIERFIQLGSEGNIRLANPTTAAQYFHLLRRQARIAKPRPLVVFTPKGLLRLQGGRLLARGAHRRQLPVRPRRPADGRPPRGDRPPGPLQRQGLLRHRPARPPRGRDHRRGRPGRAPLPVRPQRAPRP